MNYATNNSMVFEECETNLRIVLSSMCKLLLKQIRNYNSLEIEEIPISIQEELLQLYWTLGRNKRIDFLEIKDITNRLSKINKNIHAMLVKKHIN